MVCFTCIGQGYTWSPYRKTIWPCPNCEGIPHPEIGPATISVRSGKKN